MTMLQLIVLLWRRIWLTKEEKEACSILMDLWYDESEAYYKCPHNDMVLAKAKAKLNGRDPIEFMKKIFGGRAWKDDMDIAKIDNLV